MALAEETRFRDYAWAALAIVMLGLEAVNLAACLFFLFRGDLGVLLTAPVSLLFAYWIGMGAWRRTVWGRPLADTGVTGEPASPRPVPTD